MRFSIFECLLFALYLSHSVCCHQDANARTRVHEYGGGDYTIHPSGGVVYRDFATQRLFWNNFELRASKHEHRGKFQIRSFALAVRSFSLARGKTPLR